MNFSSASKDSSPAWEGMSLANMDPDSERLSNVDAGSAVRVRPTSVDDANPANVRAHVFASNGSVHVAFDAWASVGRDEATIQPVPYLLLAG